MTIVKLETSSPVVVLAVEDEMCICIERKNENYMANDSMETSESVQFDGKVYIDSVDTVVGVPVCLYKRKSCKFSIEELHLIISKFRTFYTRRRSQNHKMVIHTFSEISIRKCCVKQYRVAPNSNRIRNSCKFPVSWVSSNRNFHIQMNERLNAYYQLLNSKSVTHTHIHSNAPKYTQLHHR